MRKAVAWAVVFVADENNWERMVERMSLHKEQARAERYAGDPLRPHDEPKKVRPLGFLDE